MFLQLCCSTPFPFGGCTAAAVVRALVVPPLVRPGLVADAGHAKVIIELVQRQTSPHPHELLALLVRRKSSRAGHARNVLHLWRTGRVISGMYMAARGTNLHLPSG